MTKKEDAIDENVSEEDLKAKPKKKGKKDRDLERINALEIQLLSVEETVNGAHEKCLRACAELENFKKRKETEVENFKKYAQGSYVEALLPILDSFDRACGHSKTLEESLPKEIKEVVDGFVLIQKQFHTVLERLGVQSIEALNKQFDPNFHEAILQEEGEGVESNIVIKEMQTGYILNGKVIRPSMVVVSK